MLLASIVFDVSELGPKVMVQQGFIMVDGAPFFVHHTKVGSGVRIILHGHHLSTIEGNSTDMEMQATYPRMTELARLAYVRNNTRICFIDESEECGEPISFRPLNEHERVDVRARIIKLMEDRTFRTRHNLRKIKRTVHAGLR